MQWQSNAFVRFLTVLWMPSRLSYFRISSLDADITEKKAYQKYLVILINNSGWNFFAYDLVKSARSINSAQLNRRKTKSLRFQIESKEITISMTCVTVSLFYAANNYQSTQIKYVPTLLIIHKIRNFTNHSKISPNKIEISNRWSTNQQGFVESNKSTKKGMENRSRGK